MMKRLERRGGVRNDAKDLLGLGLYDYSLDMGMRGLGGALSRMDMV